MNRRLVGFCTLVASMPFCTAVLADGPAGTRDAVMLKAASLHVGNGEVFAGGMVLIQSGKIIRVGTDLSVPEGTKLIEVESGSITPGLIDANAQIDTSGLPLADGRDARQVAAELFVSHEGHHHGPGGHKRGVDCCGSTCPLSLEHVEGQKCLVCGFPDSAPAFAVGSRFTMSGLETSSEVIPHTRVLDAVDLRSSDFDRLLNRGVTTVFISPDPGAVISSQGAIVRTGGPINDRVIREADAVMAAMGTDPSWRGWSNRRPWRENVSFYSRRPTTRMGVAWVFRKAMHDTRRFTEGLPVSGADAPSESAMDVLARVLKRDVPLRIQARMHHDILTAFRLAEEFGLRFTLVEATEAHRCIDELKATETPVVYGPVYITPPGARRGSMEVDQARLHTLQKLLAAGIPTALTAHELRDEDGLAQQAMYAVKFGVDPRQAMVTVTQTPAKLLGIADQIGTLEAGKRADLVVWSGEPFDGLSRPVLVIVGGEVVVDRRG